jgi:hypothetical protein
MTTKKELLKERENKLLKGVCYDVKTKRCSYCNLTFRKGQEEIKQIILNKIKKEGFKE